MKKSIVRQTAFHDSFNIFKDELVPAVTDVRGEKILFDLGDYLHGILDHPEMPSRVRWIIETLKHPEEIRQHWAKELSHRELYVNMIYEDASDPTGQLHIVVIDRRWSIPRFWTTFIPKEPQTYRSRLRQGKLIWQTDL